MNLKFHSEDNDNCSVYFRDDQERLYCWQWNGRADGFRFMRCTTDGEPSYQVDAPAQTPRNPGDTGVGQDLNAFLDQRAA